MLLAIRLNICNLSARKHVLQETATCVGNLQEICMTKSPKSSRDLRDPNLLKLSHTERNRNHNDENSRSHRVLGGRGENTGRYRAKPSADSALGAHPVGKT